MKKNTPPLWTALVLPTLWAFDVSGETLVSAPTEGLTLRKAYTNEAQLTLDDSSTTVNGASQDFDLEMSASTTQTYTFVDEYVKVDDGNVLRLERTFDQLSSTTSRTMVAPVMGEVDSSAAGTSELEGLTVAFDWNDDDDEYTVSFAEEDGGDEDLLEGLTFDLDFAGILPDDEVTAGAEWSIDPELFRACFAPGGSLKLDMEVDGDEMGMNGPEPSPDLVLGDLSGEASATLVSIDEEERVAVIRIQVDISTAKDLTDLMTEMMDGQEGPPGAEMSLEAFDMEFEFEGEGEVRWSLETGTLVSLELSGEQTSSTDTAMTMSMGGNEMQMENSMTLSGSNSIRLEVTVEG